MMRCYGVVIYTLKRDIRLLQMQCRLAEIYKVELRCNGRIMCEKNASGEYAERIDNVDELLGNFLDTFLEESSAMVQCVLLTAIVKLFLKVPNNTQGLVQRAYIKSFYDITILIYHGITHLFRAEQNQILSISLTFPNIRTHNLTNSQFSHQNHTSKNPSQQPQTRH